MAGVGLTAGILPSIKCSICGVQVEVSLMVDHSCSPLRQSTRPLDQRFYQDSSNSHFSQGSIRGRASPFHPKRPSLPQHIVIGTKDRLWLEYHQPEPTTCGVDQTPSSRASISSGRSHESYNLRWSTNPSSPPEPHTADDAKLDFDFTSFPTTPCEANTGTKKWDFDNLEERSHTELCKIPSFTSSCGLKPVPLHCAPGFGTSTFRERSGIKNVPARPPTTSTGRTRPSLASILQNLRRGMEDVPPLPLAPSPHSFTIGADEKASSSGGAGSKTSKLTESAHNLEESSCQTKPAGVNDSLESSTCEPHIPERLREACRNLVKSEGDPDYEMSMQHLYFSTAENDLCQTVPMSPNIKATTHPLELPSPILIGLVRSLPADNVVSGQKLLTSPTHSDTFSFTGNEKDTNSSEKPLIGEKFPGLSFASSCEKITAVAINETVQAAEQHQRNMETPYRTSASSRSYVFVSRSSSRTGLRSPVAITPPLPLRNASRRGVVHNFAEEYNRISTSSSAAQFEYASPHHTSSDSASSSISAAWTANSGSSRSSLPSRDEEWCSGSIPANNYGFLHLLHSDFPPPLKRSINSNLPDSPTDPNIHKGRFSPMKSTRTPPPAIMTRSRPIGTTMSATSSPSSIFRPILKRSATDDVRIKGCCRGCSQLITTNQKSVSSADGRLTGRYHKQCFCCHECKSPFATADFYVLSDRPYCTEHYHSLNGSLCSGCGTGIEGQYLETAPWSDEEIAGEKFHPQCLACATCHQPLKEEYYEFNGKVYCGRDARKAANRQKSIGLAVTLPNLNDSGFYFDTALTSPRHDDFLPPPSRGRFPERRTTKLMDMI